MDHDGHYRGIELKLRRIRAGVRQYRVAQELGIPPTVLCDWENERRPIPPVQGQRILTAIDRLAARGLAGAVDDAGI
jgi:predicted transcriptional regulator